MTYVPPRLRQPSIEYAVKVAQHIGFATVIQPNELSPTISHLPINIDHDTNSAAVTVRFHVASGNQLVDRLANSSNVVMIFRGPDGYISSRWYDHENVATWNYIAVHMQGTATAMSETDLRSHVLELADHFEPGIEIRDAFVDKYLPAIRGFIVVNPTIEPVFKLSQDKNNESFEGVVRGLRSRSQWQDNPLATAMEDLIHQLNG